MAKKYDLSPGDRVDLYEGNGPEYRSLVELAEDSGKIVVVAPTYKGVPVILHVNHILQLSYYRDNGKYNIAVRVTGFRTSDNVRLVELEGVSEVAKLQRRAYYRLPVVLRTEVRLLPVELPTELHRLPDVLPMLDDVISYDEAVEELDEYTVSSEASTTRDLSISGLSVKTRTEFSIGDKLVVKVNLGWPSVNGQPISAVVEVRRVDVDALTGMYYIGLEFVGAFAKRDLITKFIYEKQQQRIKQDKLIKDD